MMFAALVGLAALGALATVTGCSSDTDNAEAATAERSIAGVLVFADPRDIKIWNFANETIDTLWDRVDAGPLDEVQGLTFTDDHTLVFGSATSNRGELHRVNLTTSKHERLRSGQMPTYVPAHDTLLFYDFDTSEQRWGLYAIAGSDLSGEPLRLWLCDKPGYTDYPIVTISADEVLFSLGAASDGLMRYRFDTQAVEKVAAFTHEPFAVDPTTGELIALREGDLDPTYVNLGTGAMRTIAQWEGIPAAYIAANDSILKIDSAMQWFPPGERSDVWIHELASNESRRVRRGMALWRKSALWLAEDPRKLP